MVRVACTRLSENEGSRGPSRYRSRLPFLPTEFASTPATTDCLLHLISTSIVTDRLNNNNLRLYDTPAGVCHMWVPLCAMPQYPSRKAQFFQKPSLFTHTIIPQLHGIHISAPVAHHLQASTTDSTLTRAGNNIRSQVNASQIRFG